MSTRANLTIKQYNVTWKFAMHSYPIPKDVVPSLLTLVDRCDSVSDIYLSRLQDEFSDISLGHIGNADYFYEVDIVTKSINVWYAKWHWVNAPDDWEERGWMGLYEGKNGRLGYSNKVKGKKIDISEYVFDHKL